MRLRITLTLFALVAVALFLAGTVSLILVRHAQSNTAQQALVDQTKTLANDPSLVSTDNLTTLTKLASFASGGSVSVGLVEVSGTAVNVVPPSSAISAGSVDVATLLAGNAISSSHNHVAFAIAPFPSLIQRAPHRQVVALYLESHINFSPDNVWYFLGAGGVALAVAAAVAAVVSQRISKRVGAVALAARQIAGGDLGTRLQLEGRTYPELRELDASINTMAADLERAQQGEREFLMAISHEFRTPLTSIRGYAEAIAEDAVESPSHAAGVVIAESERLEHLIGDLLDLARLRARQFALELGAIDLVAVCRQGADALRLAFEQEHIALEVDLPDERVSVEADYHRLAQIVANLLENAQRFARSRVTLSVSHDDTTATLAVSDNGPGIHAEDQQHVFERLFKSDRHHARTSGSGLGLAIVAELVAAMGATISVRSPIEGGGTEMAVRFPLRESSVAEARPATRTGG